MEYIGIQKKNGGVVEALQQAILSGQIPAGTEMTQNELAESLGVSRMPVREALMPLPRLLSCVKKVGKDTQGTFWFLDLRQKEGVAPSRLPQWKIELLKGNNTQADI